MASKRGHEARKEKMTKKVQIWNFIMNVTHGDDKNAKIIQKIQLGEATQGQKSNIYSTVG